ncbi:MAG: fumarylacetoacetate hydrolase family protein [Solirubrobacteraceae bacterium]|jgi:2-keto-4-pentenoate hydratase/2-oxohepta-3-ene-1,7-dioic acid hydratase in catechol pathway
MTLALDGTAALGAIVALRMRVANVDGRLAFANGGGFVDACEASAGRFGPDPQSVYDRWDEFSEWASSATTGLGEEVAPERLGPPAPAPRQVFAVALNYPEHAAEGSMATPEVPLIFTKFPTCLVGARASVALATPFVDWEIELVAVIARRAVAVAEEAAWDHVAGVTVGQDLSARDVQFTGPAPQFSLAKSFPGFGPTGPWLLSSDEPAARAELELECLRNGERVQRETTGAMTFSVAQLIAYVSGICPLLPGDLLFTGTPSGVGSRREAPVYLKAGDELVSAISGIGEIRQTFYDA